MRAVWFLTKVSIVVIVSLFLYKIDGNLTLEISNYEVYASSTAFLSFILITLIIVWKSARALSLGIFGTRMFFQKRSSNKKIDAFSAILNAQSYFARGDIVGLKKAIRIVERAPNINEGSGLILSVQLSILEGKPAKALRDYEQIIKAEIGNYAGYLLHKYLSYQKGKMFLNKLIDIQRRNDCLQEWGYIVLTKQSKNFSEAIAILDKGFFKKDIGREVYSIQRAYLFAKFKKSNAIDECLNAWKINNETSVLSIFAKKPKSKKKNQASSPTQTSQNSDIEGDDYISEMIYNTDDIFSNKDQKDEMLLKAFKLCCCSISIAQFKSIEKVVKSNNLSSYKLLSFLATQSELWGLARDYINLACKVDLPKAEEQELLKKIKPSNLSSPSSKRALKVSSKSQKDKKTVAKPV